MNQYQRDTQSYLRAISDKLDRLKKADPNSKYSGQHHMNNPMNDPGYMDPMEWQAKAAMEYMNRNNRQ